MIGWWIFWLPFFGVWRVTGWQHCHCCLYHTIIRRCIVVFVTTALAWLPSPRNNWVAFFCYQFLYLGGCTTVVLQSLPLAWSRPRWHTSLVCFSFWFEMSSFLYIWLPWLNIFGLFVTLLGCMKITCGCLILQDAYSSIIWCIYQTNVLITWFFKRCVSSSIWFSKRTITGCCGSSAKWSMQTVQNHQDSWFKPFPSGSFRVKVAFLFPFWSCVSAFL